MSSTAWNKIFSDYDIFNHNFDISPYYINAEQIKESTKSFKKTADREVRLLCKQDTRESRPDVFKEFNLFLLPVKNGEYVIIKGDGYTDIPSIKGEPVPFKSKLNFTPLSYSIGNSEMQHVDFAFSSGLITHYLNDESLILSIRGRKYTPPCSFKSYDHILNTQSVQTEVDAGYEGINKIVLIEVKNSKTTNVITRQLFYPYLQWKTFTGKEVIPLFFEKRNDEYHLWKFKFHDDHCYNSIQLIDSSKFRII